MNKLSTLRAEERLKRRVVTMMTETNFCKWIIQFYINICIYMYTRMYVSSILLMENTRLRRKREEWWLACIDEIDVGVIERERAWLKEKRQELEVENKEINSSIFYENC